MHKKARQLCQVFPLPLLRRKCYWKSVRHNGTVVFNIHVKIPGSSSPNSSSKIRKIIISINQYLLISMWPWTMNSLIAIPEFYSSDFSRKLLIWVGIVINTCKQIVTDILVNDALAMASMLSEALRIHEKCGIFRLRLSLAFFSSTVAIHFPAFLRLCNPWHLRIGQRKHQIA